MQITINGKPHEVSYDGRDRVELSYQMILNYIDRRLAIEGRLLTVTWRLKDGRGGELAPGQTVMVSDGAVFNVTDTSSA